MPTVELFKELFGSALAKALIMFHLCSCAGLGNAGETDYFWEFEEVLTQLSEMKGEISANKKEIAKLKEVLLETKGDVRGPLQKRVPVSFLNALGGKSVKVGIVEFADFQCPYCARHFKNTLPLIKSNYVDQGKVAYFSRQFPLSFHSQARAASSAVICGGEQNKFWEMHSYLFENSRSISPDLIQASVANLSLNQKTFSRCLVAPKTGAQIEQDLLLGQSLGVTGTPKFFIGRIKGEQLIDLVPLSGAQPYSAFQRVIDSFLN